MKVIECIDLSGKNCSECHKNFVSTWALYFGRSFACDHNPCAWLCWKCLLKCIKGRQKVIDQKRYLTGYKDLPEVKNK
jgi:hypothetical protein